MMNQAQLLIAMNDVKPVDTFQGLNVFNLNHVLNALMGNGLLPADYFYYLSYQDVMELVDEACEVLDATVYSYPKHGCYYPDGVKVALANSCRGFVLEDLS